MSEATRTPADEDCYLWDRTGKADPRLERWEAALAEVRAATPLPGAPEFASAMRRTRAGNWRTGLALAAGVILTASAALFWHALRPTTVALEPITGAPTIAGTRIEEPTIVAPGKLIETGAAAQARLRVGRIGWVRLERETAVQIAVAEPARYHLSLRRGSIRADISAPPGVFVVDVPFASAIDLGCVYDLAVSDAGHSVLTVESGWVLLESSDRQALVPEGARAVTRGELGVGSPYYLDASPQFVESLAQVDFGKEDMRAAALGALLSEARTRDALTLLTLLSRLDMESRLRVHDGLRILLPPPAGVTRVGISAGDQAMIDLWWRALDLKFEKKRPIAIRPP